MIDFSNSRQVWSSLTVLSTLAVAAALVAQHGFGIQPCPWCVLQRLILVVIAVVCLVGLIDRTGWFRIATGGSALVLALCGVAAALWQHFVAAKSESCMFTLADKIIEQVLRFDRLLPAVFAPRVSCAAAAVNLFGIPFDFWSLGVFALIGYGAVRILGSARSA